MKNLISSIFSNPFKDEKNGLRSKRVQGLLMIGLSMIGAHNGWFQAGGIIHDILAAVNTGGSAEGMAQLGALWGLLGTATAKDSPRDF